MEKYIPILEISGWFVRQRKKLDKGLYNFRGHTTNIVEFFSVI